LNRIYSLALGHPKWSLARPGNPVIDEPTLTKLEREYSAGLTSVEILDVFASHDVSLSEATLRKYVQLGLLPRSVRVGRKGKHQGSQGVYPVSVVRQILRIKQMMAESFTIEQIQREFLFIRNDIEQLEQMLGRIFKKLDGVLKERKQERSAQAVQRDMLDARGISKDLMARLVAIEDKLTKRNRIESVAAS
jgi:DNA-binding transcriptional MerR regulator